MLKAPIAAMFELSVCTGLITVIFISVISLTNPVYAGQKKINEMSMVKKNHNIVFNSRSMRIFHIFV